MFSNEDELVGTLTSAWAPSPARDRGLHWRREVGLGARIADALMFVPQSPASHLGDQRVTMRDLRLIAEVLQRPLRASTVAARVYSRPTDVNDRFCVLQRRGLVHRTGSSWSVAPTTAALLPSYTAAIEAKLTDWRSAVRQAAYYTLYVHHSFVAMPAAQSQNERLRNHCREVGVGLLLVHPDSSTSQVVRPRRRPQLFVRFVLS